MLPARVDELVLLRSFLPASKIGGPLAVKHVSLADFMIAFNQNDHRARLASYVRVGI